ncbi:MAG: hypothetical protein ACLSE4_16615 [Clostridium sp.]
MCASTTSDTLSPRWPLSSGVDVKTLSSMLGHYSAGFTLDTYTHITNDMQRGAAEKIGGFMESATAKPDTRSRPDPPEESRCKVIPFGRWAKGKAGIAKHPCYIKTLTLISRIECLFSCIQVQKNFEFGSGTTQCLYCQISYRHPLSLICGDPFPKAMQFIMVPSRHILCQR